MKPQIILPILAVIIIGIAGILFLNKNNKARPAISDNAPATAMKDTESAEGMEYDEAEYEDEDVEDEAMMQPSEAMMAPGNAQYTLAEVSAHGKEGDCWLVIKETVYDVSDYTKDHPGGEAILQGCGKDATDLFYMRPEDNKPHSQKAIDYLPNFAIGTLLK